MNERAKTRRIAGLPSRASDYLILAFDAVLLFLLAGIIGLTACVYFYGSIPLPSEWIQKRIQEADIAGLRLECGEMGLTLDGTVRIENPVLFQRDAQEPVFEAAEVSIRLRRLGNSLVPKPDIVIVNGGTLFLPAIHSPDGNRMAILERCAFKFKQDREQFRLERFAARHLDIALRGSLIWPRGKPASGPREDLDAVLERIFALLARGTRETHRLSAYEQPTFFFNLGRNAEGEISGPVSISSSGVKTRGIEVEDMSMRTEVRVVDGTLVQAGALVLEADRVARPQAQLEIVDVTGRAAEGEWNRFLAGEPVDLRLAAASLRQAHVEIEAPVLIYTPETVGRLKFRGSAGGYGGAFIFSGRTDIKEGSLEVSAAGGVDVLGILPGAVTRGLMAATWKEPPYVNMAVRFEDGFTLQEADFSLQSGLTSVESVDFDDIHVSGTFRDGRVDLHDFLIAREPQWIAGKGSFDTRTRAYQATLRGSIVPRTYNAIMPDWWARIFKNTRFQQPSSSYADVFLRGHLGDGANRFIFGSFEGTDLLYKEVPLDEAALKIRARGRHVEIFDIDARGPGGTVAGRVATTSRADNIPASVSTRYAISGNLMLETLRDLIGGGTAELLGNFESDHPIRLSAEGVAFRTQYYPEYAGLNEVNVEVSTPHPVGVHGAVLDSLDLRLRSVASTSTHLRDVRFAFGGGSGTANADFHHPTDGPSTLRVLGYLEDARRSRVTACIGQLMGNEEDPEPAGETDQTRMDLDLHVEIPLDDPPGAIGFGRFFLEDPNLGAINLLGPVSRLLSRSAVFSFTTLTLDTASTSFELVDRSARFDDIRIVGPNHRIAMNGTYHFDDQALAFSGFLHPLGNTQDRGFPRRTIGRVLSPFSRALSFRLTGTLDNPRARSVLDPRNLVPGL